jgi:replicative DNA helicase
VARVASEQADNLPHNLDAERAVLGACLVDPDAIYRVRDLNLLPDDYFHFAHRLVWRAILDVTARGRVADLLTVQDVLAGRTTKGQTDLAAIGGAVALVNLVQSVGSTVTVGNHAEIVKRTAGQRRLIATAGDIAALASQHDGGLDGLYDQASQLFLAAVDVSESGSHLVGSDDALMRYLEAQADTTERLQGDPDSLIEVPWAGLRRILGDLPAGFIHTIAAESSVGKTMYMEGVAEFNAKRGHRIAYYHLELTHQFMFHRLMCRHAGGAGVTMQQLRRGYHGAEVAQAMDAVRRWLGNITYVHCPGWSAERVAADAQRLHAQGRCDLIVVDYLQKLALPEGKGLNASMLIGLQAEVLKNCAERLGVPVVLGTQINRANKHENRRPSRDDIRNSGEVDERSNQTVVLHRPVQREEQSPNAVTERIEAYVDKNTSGETGVANLLHVFGRYLLAEPEERLAQWDGETWEAAS